jgi:hypothetical protein
LIGGRAAVGNTALDIGAILLIILATVWLTRELSVRALTPLASAVEASRLGLSLPAGRLAGLVITLFAVISLSLFVRFLVQRIKDAVVRIA